MSFFGDLDCELQKDLIAFVEAEEERKGKTFGEELIADILENIINGECKITGCATDHKKKKMYVEFTFFEENTGC